MKKLITSFVVFAIFAVSPIATIFAQEQSPILEIVTPANDQTLYGNRVPTIFLVENFTLIDPQGLKPTDSQGHILAWLDEQNPTVDNAVKITADTFTFADVPYGEHSLEVQLVTSDNKPLSPNISQTVKFKTEELPSAPAAQETSFDKNTTIVILIIVALIIAAAWWYTKDEDIEEELSEKTTAKKTTRKVAKKKVTRKKK